MQMASSGTHLADVTATTFPDPLTQLALNTNPQPLTSNASPSTSHPYILDDNYLLILVYLVTYDSSQVSLEHLLLSWCPTPLSLSTRTHMARSGTHLADVTAIAVTNH